MEKEVYQQRIDAVEQRAAEIKKSQNEMIKSFNEVGVTAKALFAEIAKMRSSFKRYAKNLGEVNFSGSVTTAEDIFPGIRTVNLENSIEDIAEVNNEMREDAESYDKSNDEVARLKHHLEENLQRFISDMNRYLEASNEVFEEEEAILKDLDSVYDIGLLKKSI